MIFSPFTITLFQLNQFRPGWIRYTHGRSNLLEIDGVLCINKHTEKNHLIMGNFDIKNQYRMFLVQQTNIRY